MCFNDKFKQFYFSLQTAILTLEEHVHHLSSQAENLFLRNLKEEQIIGFKLYLHTYRIVINIEISQSRQHW